ncbi:protein LURP-one-related 14-like isoform X2 [Durio zibethinus]|uniref:Protein LURP-one-related 14-like isoform X2 n=1 Tax=Durio zibethinus TaxID=66656 RepID=A0A6P6AI28_DURZI|nr:protein LURP-one-related 14-like isoform X2 [Durio zibethinus]
MASDDQIIKVVGDRFCVPYTMELLVKRKIQSLSNAHYDVIDTTGNVLLQVDGGVWNFHKKRVMKDPAGLPVITLREKALSWKQQWLIHQGESSEKKHFVCSVQRSSALHIKNNLDVYLANRYKEDGRDFRVTGSFASLSFKVRKGNSIIAEVSHNFTWGSCKGKESFKVKVYPEVDYAFIAALVVIMHENDNA